MNNDHIEFKILRNDYNQEFIESGEYPTNFVREADSVNRFANYPKWQKLLNVCNSIHLARVHPPVYYHTDLCNVDLTNLITDKFNFDVVYIDPPWEEYFTRTPDVFNTFRMPDNVEPTVQNNRGYWTYEELSKLNIGKITGSPSFLFIWAGSKHLDDARALLIHWGFRRGEDITWIKTVPETKAQTVSFDMLAAPYDKNSNIQKKIDEQCRLNRVLHWNTEDKKDKLFYYDEETCILHRTKEHCLMGIKGAIRRNFDSFIVHTNIDTDVLVDDIVIGCDNNGLYSTKKPYEMYNIIERFAKGRRKLELFGSHRNIRPGWLTIGLDVDDCEIHYKEYMSWFDDVDIDTGNAQSYDFLKNSYPNIKNYKGGRYEGTSAQLELLRPKSPINKFTNQAAKLP